ncbi:MAG: hypothetical protein KDE27_27065 [Planctomycetes bacterium]|nr:hypothetical protein [Planctomycetota bacterium]
MTSQFAVRQFAVRLLAAASLIAATAAAQKLQVYVLAGQSNMQGHAKVETLDYLADDPATAPLLAKIVDDDGKPRVLEHVWVSYLTNAQDGDGEGTGRLTAGFGARRDAAEPGDKIGPELTFGITVAAATKAPVLLVKCAWGGKSLHTDFRPPSAGPYVFSAKQREQLAAKGELERAEADKLAATGVYYQKTIEHVQRVLADPKRVCPEYDSEQGFELAGFVWFQGWNDMVDGGTYPDRGKPGGYDAYSEVLAHFIRDVRRDLGADELPFVIGVMGVGGALREGDRYAPVHGSFRAAMAAPAELPEFRGNVVAVGTAPFWDTKLQAIADDLDKVRAMERRLRTKDANGPNADGAMDAEAQKAWLRRYRDETVGAENERIWQRGASNAAYHYLGSAKILARIGVAFGEAVLRLRR